MSDRFSNSSAAAQAARNAHNAAITNSKPPVQNRTNVPSPAQAPMVLPKMVTIPLAQNPHMPSRPNTAPMVPNRTPGGPLGSASNTPNQVR